MLETVLTIPFWVELAATVAGAIAGSMSASRAQYDLFGTMVIATIMGLFGGVMRDILLQNYGIYAFQNPSLIVACAITAIIVFYFGRLIAYLDPAINVIDSLSMGMWVIISTGKALSAGLGVVPSVIIGTLTAVGGGITRDIVMNKPVAAFQPGTFYGSAALVGAIVFALLKDGHILDGWSAVFCVILIVAVRILSLAFGWRTKPSRDLTVPVADVMAKPVRAIKFSRTPDGNATGTAQPKREKTPAGASVSNNRESAGR